MTTSRILLLCILGAALLSTAISKSEIGPDDCCFKFYSRRVKKSLILSYYMTDYRCPKNAVILVSKKNRHVCADPNVPWVESIMKNVDESNI
uniref:Chemokine interleukin-8-like domain-containing protein n=1 Tax=Mola mola TaxID=94237 RepID=A0A3Q3VWZ3_MOLML